jgi:NAD-dependent SIR2 family protein deacetylase
MILGKCPTCGRGRQRTSEQNRLMWAVLTDLSEQVEWYGQKLSKEEWKCVLSAALKKQKVVPGIEGDGFVVIGSSTSKMTVAEMTELIELAMAFGAEKGVVFSEAA